MRQTIPTSFQATCRAQFFTRLEHGETSPKQTILTRFRISLYFFSETNILRFSSNFKIYFFLPLKTHKTLTWTNCSSASRTIDVTSAERDPSTCALTSASGRSLQYNDRKKRTKKPKMKVFRNLRHATHSQYKLWWLPILTRESDLSNRCGIAHYGYISAWNMMNNYKQQHEREQQRTEQEWNMSDQRLQDRKGKSIGSYADYRLQLHFMLLKALVKPLSFWHQKKSKSINSV